MMKKPVKKVVVSILSIAGLLVLMVLSYLAMFYLETRKMTPAETMKAAGDVYCVRDGFVNFFLVKKGDAYAVFDAGNDGAVISGELKKLGVDPRMVTAVFLTHTDSDHRAAAALFPNAAVFISREEEQMVNGKKNRAFVFKNRLEPGYRTLADGETVTVSGIPVRGILTPGHTPGSMCYVAEDRYLFTGDAMSLKDGKAGPFPDLFNMDSPRALQSQKRLTELTGVKYIFTAHHGFTGDAAGAFDERGR